jgi:hypothetical protein
MDHRSGPPIIRKLVPRLIVRESCGFTLRMKKPIEVGTRQPLEGAEHPTDAQLSEEVIR